MPKGEKSPKNEIIENYQPQVQIEGSYLKSSVKYFLENTGLPGTIPFHFLLGYRCFARIWLYISQLDF